MPLSWNEIRANTLEFSRKWSAETSEGAESKTFWDDFFNIFGVSRYRVASFESRVKKTDGADGYIDLLWKGVLLIEHKSRGKNLDRAHRQALDYFPGLKDSELPRYILVCDFARFRLYDLEEEDTHEFPLQDLHKNINRFAFIAGYQTHKIKEQDPANIQAAELMGRLHDTLRDVGYGGHDLEVYLVRLLFCMFAEDTGIFNRWQFQGYIEDRTGEDGADLGSHLSTLFHTLNTPEQNRLSNMDEQMSAFPFINGKLFQGQIAPASFDRAMRDSLLQCCGLDWSRISPAIFGSLFQSIMDKDARRNLGAHYTSEKNILKVINPLFMDDLRAEFNKVKKSRNKLFQFHKKLRALKFLDPACGCGNFLVVAYRELRLLELEVLRVSQQGARTFDVSAVIALDVDQFYGIEVEEFPAQIAQVAMWLIDHQMNMLVSQEFGLYFARIPLETGANIVHGNALQLDWREVIAPERLSFIMGNPPFVGQRYRPADKTEEMRACFQHTKNFGKLDYVTAWYCKAVDYISPTHHSRPAATAATTPQQQQKAPSFSSVSARFAEGDYGRLRLGNLPQSGAEPSNGNPKIKCAFVSTNSITQGEQVAPLWNELRARNKTHIHFAHRTFRWSNEARGNAAVYCVIIGFGLHEAKNKRLFEYEDIDAEPNEIKAQNINPYLVDAVDVFIKNRSAPLCLVTPMISGSRPFDGGNLLLTEEEKENLITREPNAEKWIRPYSMGREFLYNIPRYCLWLVDCPPNELRKMPLVLERVEAVRQMRLSNKNATRREFANIPSLFISNRQSKKEYLFVPQVSSENRTYLPVGYVKPEVIIGEPNFQIPNATLYEFGVVTSAMHMAWMRAVCGRLESRYRYSASVVYNNFPWPPNPTAKQTADIESKAQAVLDARAKFPDSTLADLYDPLTMPPTLQKAHQALDKATDRAYRPAPFNNEATRVAHLFTLHQQHTAPLLPKKKQTRRKK